MRTQRLERLLKLMQAIQGGKPITVEHLAKTVGVSRRTIFRDMALLADVGIPFAYDRETHRYSATHPVLLPPITLSHAEALAMMMAARYMLRRPFVTDQSAAASAALKLESMLPSPILEACGQLLSKTEVRRGQASDPSSIVDTLPVLQSALANRIRIRVRYDSYSEGEVINLTLRPYRIAYIHRGCYLIAFCQRDRKVMTFKIERILQLKMMRRRFRIDPEFNLDDYFGNAWVMIRGDKTYHVKIRFLEKVAANVDEIVWHKTQQTRYEEDGSLIFEVDVDGVGEIAWWVLGYGDQAQVLEPPKLRKLVADHAARMCKYYEGAGRAKRKMRR